MFRFAVAVLFSPLPSSSLGGVAGHRSPRSNPYSQVAHTPLLHAPHEQVYTIVPIFMVSQFSYRLALIPDHLQGRVNSVFRLIAFGSQPVGLALTGILLQGIGPVLTVLVLFIPQLALAIAVTINRHVQQARPIKQL